MKTLRYKVRFITPAFLGDANKRGQWRTPPFKAELRYWWRVVHAADNKFDAKVQEMRRAEGMLFGNAWLQEGATKSLVQVRLSKWKRGGLTSWNPGGGKIKHPEVKFPIDPALYLAYGPVSNKAYETVPAISPGEEAVLSLRFPERERYSEYIKAVLFLMRCFGSVGGRSRNGWGAYELIPEEDTPEFNNNLSQFLRSWEEALQLDWPHAIGQDDKGPLIWCTAPRNNWQDVIRDLAIIKVGVRTQFMFQHGGTQNPEPRHWLAYPVTRHKVFSWENNKSGRLPNTLRFTVKRTRDNQLKGLIFHMPCRPPNGFSPNMNTLVSVWQTVHHLLDELSRPSNQRHYAMINNTNRRNKLKPELDKITLHRSQVGGQR